MVDGYADARRAQFNSPAYSDHLNPKAPTIAEMLKAGGYRTFMSGKWHLGYPPHFGPLRSGYERFYGPMSGGVDYFTHCAGNGAHDLWEGEEEVRHAGYLTDLLSDRAVDTVREFASGDAPFLLSLHYTAPHWPWETREDGDRAAVIRDNLFDLAGGNVRTYQRMIRQMDEGIARVLATLADARRLADTLVIFTSDNGGERFSDNWPLVGGKMDLTEGGIRVPWIAQWPALIAPGRVTAQHCLTMDWSATILAAAGVEAAPGHPLDGVSLLDVLAGGAEFERPMHWRMNHRGQRALRIGRWKYLQVDGHEYLFDIDADERERANRAPFEPERLAHMRDEWQRWNDSMPPIPADATVSLGYSARDMPQR
jgi:arylsulfatase A-like enzyme